MHSDSFKSICHFQYSLSVISCGYFQCHLRGILHSEGFQTLKKVQIPFRNISGNVELRQNHKLEVFKSRVHKSEVFQTNFENFQLNQKRMLRLSAIF